MHRISIDTVPLPERVVRVRLPRKAAYDLPTFQKIQADILDRLGCKACCSGFDIRWDFARDFVVDAKNNVTEALPGAAITHG
jgi:hypothetical protein